MKFLWFEDIRKDLMKTIREVSKFIGYHMTEYKMANFIRKGKVGDWKNYLNEGSTTKIWDEWIAENIKGTDIVLPES